MTERIRSSLGVVVCALVVFAIAGSGFQKMTEYPDFTAAASQHSSIGTSFNVLRGAAVAAGIIVLAAAIPLVWTVLRQAVAGRRIDLLLRLAVPPVAIGAWIGIIKLIQAVSPQPGPRSGLDAAAAAWVIALGAVAAALCAWATLSVLRRAELPDRLLRAEVTADDRGGGLHGRRHRDRPQLGARGPGGRLLALPQQQRPAGHGGAAELDRRAGRARGRDHRRGPGHRAGGQAAGRAPSPPAARRQRAR